MGKKALIVTVGDAVNPLIKHINKLKPNFVVFIHTDDYKYKADEIVNNSFLKSKIKSSDYEYQLINDPQTITDTFRQSLIWIFDLKSKNYEVMGDITAATKTMSVGLSMACSEEGCDYYYNGESSKEARDQYGRVKDGYEKTILQSNPNDEVYYREYKRGMLFFDKYQFLASKENFIQSKKTSNPLIKDLSGILIRIVKFYDLWDKFNDEDDGIKLNDVLKDIINSIENDEILNNHFNNEYPLFLKKMKFNLMFLDKKLDGNIYYYLPDLLNNAQRRINEGKYDDAVARLYRAVELIAQLRLLNYKIVNEDHFSKNKSFRLDKDKIINKYHENTYSNIRKLNRKKWNKNELEYGSFQDYCILFYIANEKSDDLTKDLVKFYKNNVYKFIESRNKSILAHGLKPLNKNMASQTFNLVLKHAKKIYPNIKEEMEMAKFPLFWES